MTGKELLLSVVVVVITAAVFIHFARRPAGTPMKIHPSLWLFYSCFTAILACTGYAGNGVKVLLQQSLIFYVMAAFSALAGAAYIKQTKVPFAKDFRYLLYMLPTVTACVVPLVHCGWRGPDIAFVAIPVLLIAVMVDRLLHWQGIKL